MRVAIAEKVLKVRGQSTSMTYIARPNSLLRRSRLSFRPCSFGDHFLNTLWKR